MDKYFTLSDYELSELLSLDDQFAFNEIYNRYWSSVFLVVRNRLRNDSEAEEIVQNIFYQLWKKRGVFKLEKTFQKYFAVAVKYEIINQSAKKRRELNYISQLSDKLFEIDNSTSQLLSFNELKQMLEKTICVLPEKCQLVFRLKIEKDYSQKQIAQELSISEKTVEAHLSKARKYMRENLDPSFSIYIVSLLIF